jgi:8-oxo-dGTP diphosphatase
MRVITVAYYALLPLSSLRGQASDSVYAVRAGSDAKEAEWFPFSDLPKNLAFDHTTILKDCLERLRGKIVYTPIAFSFFKDNFIWSELQEVFEIILERKFIAPNFRRWIKSKYNLTDVCGLRISKGRAGRPGILLKYLGQKEEL